MTRLVFLLTAAVLASAADDSWTKVQELKSGAELRILKKGSTQPLTAVFDQADEERVFVVMKNQQLAIAKSDIDRLDARPLSKGPRKLKTESKVTTTDPDITPRPAPAAPVPGTSYSTSVGMSGSKPEFETIYRRTAASSAK